MYKICTRSDQFPVNQGRKRYKVVLNGGGGCFGYVIAYLLSKLDIDLYSKIDVAAGTSIGGILAMNYALHGNYDEVPGIFQKYTPLIFKKAGLFAGLVGPKYSSAYMQQFAKGLYGESTFADVRRGLKVVVPTFDVTLSAPRIFTNVVSEGQQYMMDIPLWQIALMTSAAPTYFDQRRYDWSRNLMQICSDSRDSQFQQKYLLAQQSRKRLQMYPGAEYASAISDGGMVQNIPVFSTYTTLKSKLGVDVGDIDMLVIGTGDDTTPDEDMVAEKMNSWPIYKWLKFIVQYVTESNQIASINFGAQMGFHSFRCWNNINVRGGMDDPGVLPSLRAQCDYKADQFRSFVRDFLQE